MIYACEGCGFLFFRRGEVSECPSCERKQIRPASAEEIESLEPFLEEQKKMSKKLTASDNSPEHKE